MVLLSTCESEGFHCSVQRQRLFFRIFLCCLFSNPGFRPALGALGRDTLEYSVAEEPFGGAGGGGAMHVTFSYLAPSQGACMSGTCPVTEQS